MAVLLAGIQVDTALGPRVSLQGVSLKAVLVRPQVTQLSGVQLGRAAADPVRVQVRLAGVQMKGVTTAARVQVGDVLLGPPGLGGSESTPGYLYLRLVGGVIVPQTVVY